MISEMPPEDSFEDSASQNGPDLFRSIGLGGVWMYRIRPCTLQAIEELGYRVAAEELGHGASSIVLDGMQPDSGHRVAIKVIVEPENANAMQQFERERRVLASKEIPPLVAPTYVHSFRRENCQPVLIMERVHGERITDYVQRRELGIPERIELLERLFEALNRLHACNLIHGDPSPNNVFVDSNGCIRLLDFGNSRRIVAGYESAIDADSRSGTPSIAPVEQTEGGLAASLHTDVYSVASIAYLVLTGEARLQEGTAEADDFHRARLSLNRVPPWFTSILIQMMRRPPGRWSAVTPPKSYSKMTDVIDAIHEARAAVDSHRRIRRRLSLAAIVVTAVMALLTWGLAPAYQNQLDIRRNAQYAIRNQIQYYLANLESAGLPRDSGLLHKLIVERELWQSDKILSLDHKEFKRNELRVYARLQEAMIKDQRLNYVLPSLNMMEKCFKATHWVQSADRFRENCSEFERELVNCRDMVANEVTVGIRETCRKLEERLSELLDSNILASKAEAARLAFLTEREILPRRLRRMPEYRKVDTIEEYGDLAWQNEAFELASTHYRKALDAILDFRDEYETEAEQSVRATLLAQRQSENQRLVDLLRSEIDNQRHHTEALTTLELHRQELVSRLNHNFQDCDGCESECQGDWVNGWVSPLAPDAFAPDGVAEVLLEKAQLREELERTQQRLKTFELILERTLQGPAYSAASERVSDIASATQPATDPTPASQEAIANRIMAIDDRATSEQSFPSQSRPLAPPESGPPKPIDQPIDLLHWIGQAAPGQQETHHRTNTSDFSLPTPGQLSLLKIAGVSVAFRYCPPCEAGSFRIGSPANEAGREVDENQVPSGFDRGFWIMQTECTNELWNAIMGLANDDASAIRLPVIDVSFDQCIDFIERANLQLAQQGHRLTTYRLSLPTEAEWEYACRAGSKTAYAFGDDPTWLREYGWFESNSNGRLQPVGTKKPNGWGIHDMHGSAWEWTLSTYSLRHDEPSFQRDSVSPSSSDAPRVTRGGSINFPANFCRSASRGFFAPSMYQNAQGFRLVVCFDPIASFNSNR